MEKVEILRRDSPPVLPGFFLVEKEEGGVCGMAGSQALR